MDPSRPRNHATEETNQERLRRQFEHGEIPRYDFSAGEIPEYPQFVESRLSSKVRKKLAHRRTLGYVNPRALTPSERDSWDLLRNVRNGIESSNTLLGSLNPTAHQTKRAAEDAVRIPTERLAAETYRYGGPLLPEKNLVRLNLSTHLYPILGVAGALGILGVLSEVNNGHGWHYPGWATLLLLVAGLLFLVKHFYKSHLSELTDTDCSEIDQACEMLTLNYDDGKEYRLVAYTAALTRRISESPGWSSDFLDSHRIQFDCDEELHQIFLHAFELHSLHVELGDIPICDDSASVGAREHIQRIAAPLDAVWGSLIDRVSALESFTFHILQLDRQLEVMEKVRHANEMENRIGALFDTTVSDEFAAEHTRTLTQDSAHASISIDATLDALRGDIAGLTELAANLPAHHILSRSGDRSVD